MEAGRSNAPTDHSQGLTTKTVLDGGRATPGDGKPLLPEKQQVINKLRTQNENLKKELKFLTEKLEQFVEKSRQRKNDKFNSGAQANEKDEQILAKENELKQSQHKIQFYKREIENMRRQLEGSYNIQKIIALEDEQKNKERILKQLQEESGSLLKVQKEQEKALKSLNKEGEYDAKISELNEELRQAKEHLRKLQFKQREDEKAMKTQHEQLVVLEERCRKMKLLIKDKKKEKQKMKEEADKHQPGGAGGDDVAEYTPEALQRLQEQLHQAE